MGSSCGSRVWDSRCSNEIQPTKDQIPSPVKAVLDCRFNREAFPQRLASTFVDRNGYIDTRLPALEPRTCFPGTGLDFRCYTLPLSIYLPHWVLASEPYLYGYMNPLSPQDPLFHQVLQLPMMLVFKPSDIFTDDIETVSRSGY